jgi:hypothetical protein
VKQRVEACRQRSDGSEPGEEGANSYRDSTPPDCPDGSESPRTTKLYDRTGDESDEVERIAI